MPTALKVVVAVNVISVVAILLAGVAIGGGFVSGVFPPDEGHEIKLIPMGPEDPAVSRPVSQVVQRAEIPPEYRKPDPSPRRWIILPDGSVRMVRND